MYPSLKKSLKSLALGSIIGLTACDAPVYKSDDVRSKEGIYSIAQTETVVDLYSTDCASCHGGALRGTEGWINLDWQCLP